MGPLFERSLAAQAVEMMMLELHPLAPLYGKHVQLRLVAQLDEVPDGREWLLGDP